MNITISTNERERALIKKAAFAVFVFGSLAVIESNCPGFVQSLKDLSQQPKPKNKAQLLENDVIDI